MNNKIYWNVKNEIKTSIGYVNGIEKFRIVWNKGHVLKYTLFRNGNYIGLYPAFKNAENAANRIFYAQYQMI